MNEHLNLNLPIILKLGTSFKSSQKLDNLDAIEKNDGGPTSSNHFFSLHF